RKAKFTDDQVDEIRRLREDGNTIKEIAKRYNCSVGLIHKLINEK
ncbi:MAG: helix-turn-helix domain-containing protein, partial [Clostridia bacterium]